MLCMIEIFLYALNAVLSILFISAFGFVLRKSGKVEEGFVKKLNSLCFKYLLPLQLFISIYGISDASEVEGGLLVFIGLYVVVAFAIGMLAAFFISPDNAKRSGIAQAFFRSNTAIMGVPLAELLGGAKAVATISVMMSVAIILYNSLAVVALTVYAPRGTHHKISVKSLLTDIANNPLIRGVIAGLICLFLRNFIPRDEAGELVFSLQGTLTPLYNAVLSLSKTSSPLMLMLIGMQFQFTAVSKMKREIFTAALSRTVLIPAIAFTCLYFCSGVMHLFEAGPEVYQACIGIVAAPGAISSAVMTAEMGGDGELTGQIVVWSTVISIFSIFGFITILRYLGFM